MKKIVFSLFFVGLVFGAATVVPKTTNVTMSDTDVLKVRNLQVKYLTLSQDEKVKSFIDTANKLNQAVVELKAKYKCTTVVPTDAGFSCQVIEVVKGPLPDKK